MTVSHPINRQQWSNHYNLSRHQCSCALLSHGSLFQYTASKLAHYTRDEIDRKKKTHLISLYHAHHQRTHRIQRIKKHSIIIFIVSSWFLFNFRHWVSTNEHTIWWVWQWDEKYCVDWVSDWLVGHCWRWS